MKEKIAVITIVILLLAVALYLGVGGMGRVEYKHQYEELISEQPSSADSVKVLYNGIEYSNMLEMEKGEKLHALEQFNKIFIGADYIPDLVSLLLTACCFSLIGALTSFLWQGFYRDQPLTLKGVFLVSILGFLTGLFVIALTYVIPVALIQAESAKVKPIGLMFFSLFSGFCFVAFFERISGFFTNFLNEKIK